MHYNTIQAGHRLDLSASCWSTNHEFDTRFCYYDYILYIKRKTNTFLKVFFSIYYHLICCWGIQLKQRSLHFLPFYCVILLNIRKIVDDYTCTMYTFQDKLYNLVLSFLCYSKYYSTIIDSEKIDHRMVHMMIMNNIIILFLCNIWQQHNN